MKKIILTTLFCWAMTAVAAFAQMPPTWSDYDMRQLEYPDSEYFTGYAEGAPMTGERQEVATQRLKDAARVEAVSTIRVHITNQSTNDMVSQQLRLTEKGGHTHNYHQAAREAYRYLTPKICKSVEEQVKHLTATREHQSGNEVVSEDTANQILY